MEKQRNGIIQKRDRLDQAQDGGYTFIEVLVTIIIMGGIVLVVNVIMISIIRVSYTTDVRIKMRQNVEFATEVFKRTARSSEWVTIVDNPEVGNECVSDFKDPSYPFHEATEMILEGGVDTVTFYVDQDPSDNVQAHCKPVLKARWNISGSTHDVNLMSPSEAALRINPSEAVPTGCGLTASVASGYDVDVSTDPATRLITVVLTLVADSAQEKNPGEPVVDCVVKEVSILRQPREL